MQKGVATSKYIPRAAQKYIYLIVKNLEIKFMISNKSI